MTNCERLIRKKTILVFLLITQFLVVPVSAADVGPLADKTLSFRFNEHWGIEGSVGLLTPTEAINDGSKDKTKINTDENPSGFLYTINGIYHFDPFSLFKPYVLAGIGVSGLMPNILNGGVQSNQINAGIGAQLFVNDTISLHGEFRNIYDTTGSDKNDYNINLGISFLLGDNHSLSKN